MNCENKFCIYQSKGECILDHVEIDRLGMCAECIYPNLDDFFQKNQGFISIT